MSLNDADAARQLNGKQSWHSRREITLRAFGLWDHYGQIPRFDQREADHREWLPGGGRRE